MFDLRGFFYGFIGIIDSILHLYIWIIIIRSLISWVNPDPYNPIVQFLYNITEPTLSFVRRQFPRLMWSTGIDLSPIIVIVAIYVIQLILRSINI